jgi:hypothetical protein
MSSKGFTKQIFDWLYQVNRDARLRSHKLDTAVALELSIYFNEGEDGRAWPSSKRIADAIHVHETSVLRAMERLSAAGHLHVVWGRPGKGHTHQYWMILKPAPEQVSDPPKPAREQVNKPARRPPKPAPTQETYSNNHRKEEGVENPPPPCGGSAPDQASEPTPEATVQVQPSTVAPDPFDDFWKVYPRQDGKPGTRRAFAKAVREGADPDDLIKAAKVYAAKCAAGLERGGPMQATLWFYNGHFTDQLPAGVTIDNDTGEPIMDAPAPKRSSKFDELQQEILASRRNYNGSAS